MTIINADTYTRVLQVLTLISQGKTPTAACIECGTTFTTFLKAVRETRELTEMFVDAEQSGMDTLADVLLRITTDEEYGSSDPKIMKIMSENIKWYLSRKRPTQYGDRMLVEHKLTADRVIVDALTRAKDRAEGRLIENKSGVVDAVYEVIDSVVIPAELRQFFS